MMGTDLAFGSVPAGGSWAGDGKAGGPGGRAGGGLRPPGTRGWAWVPAGSGLDLVPCSGLSVSLALLGKVWVLGLGRGAACGGRRCPGREALRQASGSVEVAGGQATKGSSGGGGGRMNFLIGYRAGGSRRGEQGGPRAQRMPRPPHAPPPQAHTTPGGPQGRSGDRRVGGAFATKGNDTRGNKTENVPLARAAGAPEQQVGWGPPSHPPPPWGGALGGGVTHPGAAERAGGQARGGAADGPGPGNTGAQGGSDRGLPAPPPSGGPAESPAVAPAQRRPGSAQGRPPSPPLCTRPRRPGPLGATGAPWCSWRPGGSSSPHAEAASCPRPKAPGPEGREGPSAMLSSLVSRGTGEARLPGAPLHTH